MVANRFNHINKLLRREKNKIIIFKFLTCRYHPHGNKNNIKLEKIGVIQQVKATFVYRFYNCHYWDQTGQK